MTSGVLIVGIAVVVVIAVSVYLLRRRRSVWERFARRHGLEVVEEHELGAPVLGGEVDGRRVRMYASSRSSDTGTLGAEVLTIRIALRGGVPEGLRVRWATPLEELAEGDGGAEVLRVPAPGRHFELEVRCQDRRAVERYLDDDRRRALTRLVGLDPAAEAGLEGAEIFLRERELVADIERLESRFEALREIAAELDG